jgi:hypothetical protein
MNILYIGFMTNRSITRFGSTVLRGFAMQNTNNTLRIPPWIGIGGIVVVVGLLGASVTPPAPVSPPTSATTAVTEQPDYLANPRMSTARVQALARQTGGDWNRLSSDDQQLLNGLTGGHGAAMLRMTAEQQRDLFPPRKPKR